MAKIPSRTFRFFAVPLCLSGPEGKSSDPRGGVLVCCWFSLHFQRVSTSSHHQAGKKGFQHFQNARDFHRLGGVVSAHAEFNVSDSFHGKD